MQPGLRRMMRSDFCTAILSPDWQLGLTLLLTTALLFVYTWFGWRGYRRTCSGRGTPRERPEKVIKSMLPLREMTGDLCLLFSDRAVRCRRKEWQRHCQAFAAAGRRGRGRSSVVGFEPLHWYLGALDAKFATLLQFYILVAVLAAAAGQPSERPALEPLLWASAIFWMLGIGGCLRGVFRVLWSDMGRVRIGFRDERTYDDGWNSLFHDAYLSRAEAECVDEYIVCVIRRTAWFRLVALVTVAMLLLAFFRLLLYLADGICR